MVNVWVSAIHWLITHGPEGVISFFTSLACQPLYKEEESVYSSCSATVKSAAPIIYILLHQVLDIQVSMHDIPQHTCTC